MDQPPYILYLPDVALENIFSFLTYDEIAKNRLICTKFNDVGSKILSRGFMQLDKKQKAIYRRVRTSLPRRESERRVHPLARHCDVLQAVETRMSMLNMTYMKYMEKNLTCFIPGKVLDEIKHVLRLVETEQTPPRTHQLLQELRDLSSMAMEHFYEHILPSIKEEMERRTTLALITPTKSPRIYAAQEVLSNELHKVKKQSKCHKHHISYLTQNTQELFQKLRRQNVRLKAQSLKIREQEKKIQDQNTKIQEQEATLADIKKHIDEWDQKYNDLTSELVRARDIMVKSNISHQNIHTSPVVSPSKHYKSNIKPRTTLLPKNYMSLQSDWERKRKSSLLPDIPAKYSRATSQISNELNQINSTLNTDPPLFSSDLGYNKNVHDPKTSPVKDIRSIVTNSIENLNHSLSSINARKRKMSEDIDLK